MASPADIICDLCSDPTDGYCCRRCTTDTIDHLRHAADLAGDVEITVARLARYVHRGGRRPTPPETDDTPTPTVNRRQPVTVFGWPASITRPLRGALRPERLPVDLNASAKAAHAYHALTQWARTVLNDRGHTLPPAHPGEHPAATCARYLISQADWIRHQSFAAECFDQLRAAGATIKRIVDAPPEEELVGRCDCHEYLYARKGTSTVTCPGCTLRWDVETSRDTLRKAMLSSLVTASEAGLLLAIFGINGTRRRHAKTITMWAQRNLITTHPPIEAGGPPLYLFADVIDRATRFGRRLPAA